MSTASAAASSSHNPDNSTPHNNNRIMLIVWSWKYGGMQGNVDEWKVEKTSGDKVVRIDEKLSSNAISLLQEKLQYYSEEGDVFLFLHRRHGYNHKAIREIVSSIQTSSNSNKKIRCFLFGEGNDKIYIANQNKGLLGTRGTFSATLDLAGSGSFHNINAIENEGKMQIKLKHFDFVWNQYAHNFKAKIFELKEDLFISLSKFLFKPDLEPGEIYNYIKLKGNELLFLRLLSFIGKIRKGSNLENQLKEFEQKHKRSYFFDDCQVNLKTTYSDKETFLYQQLSSTISQGLLAHQEDFKFKTLRDQFDALLGAMPEPIYY